MFLLFVGTTSAALCFGTSVISIKPAWAKRLDESCSWCGKHVEEAPVYGVIGRPWRICAGCLGLLFDIASEDPNAGVPDTVLARAKELLEHNDRPEDYETSLATVLNRNLERLEHSEELANIHRIATRISSAVDDQDIDAALSEMRAELRGPSGEAPRLRCSFCDANRIHRKLLAGPAVLICVRCMQDALEVGA